MLVAASLISYIDRQVVAIVVGPMKHDLGISDTQVGWIYGIFAVFYAVAGVPIAWLADRKSRKVLIATGVFFWSLATMTCGLVRTFPQVLLARIGVGVGEATLVPSANSLIGDYFPRPKIPFAVSVFQTGSVLGSAIAFIVGGFLLGLVQEAQAPLVPWLAGLKPWQQLFIYVGAPGLLLVPLMLLIREPVRRHGSAAGVPMRELADFYRRNRTMLLLHHLGFLSLSLMGFGFVFWTVSYFTRVHGVDAATAAQNFGWIFLLAGSFGSVWAAALAGYLARRGRKDANILAAMVGAALNIPIVLLVQMMPSAGWAYVLYVPAMLTSTSPFGLAYGSLPVVAPPAMRAMVVAVFMFVISLGMLLGPPVTGMFNEKIFPAADGIRYSLISVTLLFGVIGLTLLNFCRRHYARSLAEADEKERSG
jgi:MFS family permease